jgi:hypothetical protein
MKPITISPVPYNLLPVKEKNDGMFKYNVRGINTQAFMKTFVGKGKKAVLEIVLLNSHVV